MLNLVFRLVLVALYALLTSSWLLSRSFSKQYRNVDAHRLFRLLSSQGGGMKENLMTIDEIKAELDMRGADYTDCIARSELVQRLIETRATGKADPKMLDQFSTADIMDVREIDEDVLLDAQATDGGLPGGLEPAMLKALMADSEVMGMLSNPKMRDIMKAVMTGGPDAVKGYLSDPGIKFVVNNN